MPRIEALRLQLVTQMPDPTPPGVLFYNPSRALAIHSCCCGCGYDAVTRIEPVAWMLEDTETGPSLYPSIGNWGLPCKSHYVIFRGRVYWARTFSEKEIEAVRDRESRARALYMKLDTEAERAAWKALRGRDAAKFWRIITES